MEDWGKLLFSKQHKYDMDSMKDELFSGAGKLNTTSFKYLTAVTCSLCNVQTVASAANQWLDRVRHDV